MSGRRAPGRRWRWRPGRPAGAAVVPALALALAGPAVSPADQHPPGAGVREPPAAMAGRRAVQIPGRYFDPHVTDALVGDTVTWDNVSDETHDVNSSLAPFDSGHLMPGQSFSFTFNRPGAFHYICTIHRFMSGEIDVFSIALEPPADPVRQGALAVLSGLAPPSSGPVTLLRVVPGSPSVPVAQVPVSIDGSFRFLVAVNAPGYYRAVSGDLSSATVLVRVAPSVAFSITRPAPRRYARVMVTPTLPGTPVILEHYVRERFNWLRVASGRLDATSRAVLRVPSGLAGTLRMRVAPHAHGYGPAVSRSLFVRRGRRR